MDISTKTALAKFLLNMADDELILAHRNSEWIGHAPILEEDIALANIAQDELGHAMIWYGLHQQLTDGETPDRLVYFRDAEQYQNAQMLELPKGDWAFTLLRQYLFDAYEMALLTRLTASSYTPLADAVAKIKQEELYHYRHSSLWVKRLGLGTEESHRRMQLALDTLWPYTQQLFTSMEEREPLVQADIAPEHSEIYDAWQAVVLSHLEASGLQVLTEVDFVTSPRADHTEHLTELLTDLQLVAHMDPDADW